MTKEMFEGSKYASYKKKKRSLMNNVLLSTEHDDLQGNIRQFFSEDSRDIP